VSQLTAVSPDAYWREASGCLANTCDMLSVRPVVYHFPFRRKSESSGKLVISLWIPFSNGMAQALSYS
jgi:hypothetical protein